MAAATEIFLRSAKAICPALPGDELSLFASKLSGKAFKKKEIFLQAGKVKKEICFITAGLVRSFYIDNSGNEITVGVYIYITNKKR